MGVQDKLSSIVGNLCDLDTWITSSEREDFEKIQALFPHHAFVFRIQIKDKEGLDFRSVSQCCGTCLEFVASKKGRPGIVHLSHGATEISLTLVNLAEFKNEDYIQLPLSGFTAIYFYTSWREKVHVSKQIDINLYPTPEDFSNISQAKRLALLKSSSIAVNATDEEDGEEAKITEILDPQ